MKMIINQKIYKQLESKGYRNDNMYIMDNAFAACPSNSFHSLRFEKFSALFCLMTLGLVISAIASYCLNVSNIKTPDFVVPRYLVLHSTSLNR